MQVRRLLPEEHGMTRALYEEAFPEDSQRFVDYYYTEVVKNNRIYVVEEDGGIRAMLHLNPYKVRLNGDENELDYIVAVATQKEYRRRGYMAALIKMVLQDMYQEGKPLTYLMPASEEIYLPHDFRTVYEQDIPWRKDAEESDAEGIRERNAEDVCLTELEEEQCKALADFAEKYLAENYQMYTMRDQAYYERMKREYTCDDGKIFVRTKDGQIVGCEYYYPPEERSGEMPEETSEGNAEEKREQAPKIMVRIVDVKRMLMSMRLRTLMAACFTVTDPLVEENNCCITVTGTEFSGVLLMEGLPKNSEGTLTIAALTELLFGVKTAEELCEEDGVQMSERLKDEFKKLIPIKQIYLNEMV